MCVCVIESDKSGKNICPRFSALDVLLSDVLLKRGRICWGTQLDAWNWSLSFFLPLSFTGSQRSVCLEIPYHWHIHVIIQQQQDEQQWICYICFGTNQNALPSKKHIIINKGWHLLTIPCPLWLYVFHYVWQHAPHRSENIIFLARTVFLYSNRLSKVKKYKV